MGARGSTVWKLAAAERASAIEAPEVKWAYGKETTMSKWIGMTIAPAVTGRSPFESPSTQARSLEGRPLGMGCSVMLPEAAMLRLLELGSSFVAALGEQRHPLR